MQILRLLIIGPGRAGMSLAFAAREAGHDIEAVVGRDREHARPAADDLGVAPLGIDDPLPQADLALIAVRDSAIEAVAAALAASTPTYDSAAHLSGLKPVGALAALRRVGVAIGSFHPLQTLPNASAGSRRLAGSWIAVTGDEELAGLLTEFAASLDARPFALADEDKPVYHAAAAAAANFPIASLAMAKDLFAASGVDFAVARPLVEAIVANAFELGPRAALTGPVARGDVETVASQISAVREHVPEWEPAFRAFVDALARLTGRRDQFTDIGREGR